MIRFGEMHTELNDEATTKCYRCDKFLSYGKESKVSWNLSKEHVMSYLTTHSLSCNTAHILFLAALRTITLSCNITHILFLAFALQIEYVSHHMSNGMMHKMNLSERR